MKSIQSARLPTRWSPGARTSALLVALTLFAFGLRVFGARSSIAYIPDTQIIRQALDLGQSFTTRSFDINLGGELKYPQTLHFYLLFVYGLVFVGGLLSRQFSGLAGFTTFLFTQRETIHFISVLALGVLASAAVPLGFVTARKLNSQHTGWLAAGLVTVDLILVQFGHQARPHAVLATLSLASVFLLARLIKDRVHWSETVAATLVCALTIGTLQSGLLITIPFGLVWLIRLYDAWRLKTLRGAIVLLMINLVILVGLAFILYPPIFTEYSNLVRDLLFKNPTISLGGGIHTVAENLFGPQQIPRFINRFFGYQPLPAVFFLPALLYFIWTLRHQWRLLVVALSFPLANLIIWSNFFTAARYWGALSLFNDILCAYFIESLCISIAQPGRTTLTLNRALLFTAFVIPALIQVGRLDYVLAQPDTRTQASRWVQEHLPGGTALTANFQLLELTPDQISLQRQAQDYPRSLGTYYQWLLQQTDRTHPAGPAYNIVDYSLYWPDDVAQQHELTQRLNIKYAIVQTTLTFITVDTRLFDYAQKYGQPVAVFCPGSAWESNYLPNDVFALAWPAIWKVDNPGPITVIYQLQSEPNRLEPQLTCQ
jgi:4-amino-4-deoxy-L-arabinose transferase-like glycosyltransferase